MSYIQSFLYNIDNHLLLRNCISLLISVSKLLFYLYPIKYRRIFLNIYQQVMSRIAGVQRNMNNRIVCFVTDKIALMPNLPDIHQKRYKQSVVLNEQECFFLKKLCFFLFQETQLYFRPLKTQSRKYAAMADTGFLELVVSVEQQPLVIQKFLTFLQHPLRYRFLQ